MYGTYAALMKSFISALYVIPSSSSNSGGYFRREHVFSVVKKSVSTSFCVMSIISSICEISCGKGKRFWTSSRRVIPVDHTSDRMLYCSPARRSGYVRTPLV